MLVEKPATASERDRMVELERVVDTGLYTFVEVGLGTERDPRQQALPHQTPNIRGLLPAAVEVHQNLRTPADCGSRGRG